MLSIYSVRTFVLPFCLSACLPAYLPACLPARRRCPEEKKKKNVSFWNLLRTLPKHKPACLRDDDIKTRDSSRVVATAEPKPCQTMTAEPFPPANKRDGERRGKGRGGCRGRLLERTKRRGLLAKHRGAAPPPSAREALSPSAGHLIGNQELHLVRPGTETASDWRTGLPVERGGAHMWHTIRTAHIPTYV